MRPKISIILPNFNSEKYIKTTIKSILNQTFKKWELIIVDDNSNKNTLNILKNLKNKKIKIIFLKRNKGVAYCRNLAIKKSSGEYLAFLDSDDIWNKKKLALQYNFMKKNNYSFTYTNYELVDEISKSLGFVFPPKYFTFDMFVKNTSIGTSTMMIKKSISKNVNFTNTLICEDYYYKCKILKKIGSAKLLNSVLSKYRIRGDSLQSNKLRNFYWMWKINKDYNKFTFFKNFKSLFFISFNSLKKYGFK